MFSVRKSATFKFCQFLSNCSYFNCSIAEGLHTHTLTGICWSERLFASRCFRDAGLTLALVATHTHTHTHIHTHTHTHTGPSNWSVLLSFFQNYITPLCVFVRMKGLNEPQVASGFIQTQGITVKNFTAFRFDTLYCWIVTFTVFNNCSYCAVV